jgi:photosystem II P680 reaction center D1 protein
MSGLYNGIAHQLVIFHFLIGIFLYMGREWELSYRLQVCVLGSGSFLTPVASSNRRVLDLPIGQGSFSTDGMPLGISRYSSGCCHMLGFAGVFGGALFRDARFFDVAGLRRATETELQNYGYKFD